MSNFVRDALIAVGCVLIGYSVGKFIGKEEILAKVNKIIIDSQTDMINVLMEKVEDENTNKEA